MTDQSSHPTEACATCGEPFQLDVSYPVVVQKQDAEFCYYSFCNETCEAAWKHQIDDYDRRHSDVGGETVTEPSVAFMDIHGQYGVITERLDVDYTGEWEATVKEWAAEKKDEWIASGADDAEALSSRIILNLVMIELLDPVPVVKVERIEVFELYLTLMLGVHPDGYDGFVERVKGVQTPR